MNLTRLRVRIRRFCDANGGSIRQSGESLLARGAGVSTDLFKKMRNGAMPREETLQRVDQFLQSKGY